MGLVGRFHPRASDAVADSVTPFGKGFVLRFRDRLGVAQGMGRQGAVGVVAQDVHIHLGPLETTGLLAEAQHLLGA